MPTDFKANQIRTSQLIVSGNNSTNASLMVYANPTNFLGGIPTANKVNVGSDVFVFVSGAIGAAGTSGTNGISLFGGDLRTSGSFYASKSVILGSSVLNDTHQITGSVYIRGNAKLGDLAAAYHQVTGTLDVAGVVKGKLGLSGSLTQLTDGTSYLVAGPNVTITSSSNGAVTISSSGGTGTPGGVISTIQFNNGASGFAGDTSLTWLSSSNTLTVTGSIRNTGGAFIGGGFGNSGVTITALGGIAADGDLNVLGTGSFATNIYGSANLFLTGGATLNNGLLTLVNTAGQATLEELAGGGLELRNKVLGGGLLLGVKTSAGNTVNLIDARPNGAATSTTFAILPSIYAIPANPYSSTDTNFFVGGAPSTKGGGARGTAVFGGDLVITGSTYFGRSTALDGVTFNAALASDIIPDTDKVRNLGSAAKRFANVYTGDLHLRNERGDYTLIEEEDCLTIRFNKNGKRYRFVLEPAPEFDEKL